MRLLGSSLFQERQLRILVGVALCGGWLGPAAKLRAESPTLAIDALFPPVVTVGATAEVRVAAGRFLHEVRNLVSSHPGLTARVSETAPLPFADQPEVELGVFDVQVDPATPVGYYELWGVGSQGAANPRTVAAVAEPVEVLPPTASPGNAAAIRRGICYVGQTRPRERIAMRCVVESGWPSLVVAAAALDSRALPVVVITDPRGNVLCQRRAAGRQPLVIEPADYRAAEPCPEIEIHVYDFLHRGGPEFAFALLVDPPAGHPLTLPAPSGPPAAAVLDRLADWPTVDAPPLFADGPRLLPAPPWQTTVELAPGAGASELEFPATEGQAYECETFAQALGQLPELRVVVDRVAPLEAAEAAAGVERNDPAFSEALRDAWEAREQTAPREALVVAEGGFAAGSRAVRFASNDPLLTIPPGPADKLVRLRLVDLALPPSSRQPTRVTVRVGPPVPRWHAVAFWTPDVLDPAQATTTGAWLPRGGQLGLHVSVRRAGGFAGPVEASLVNLPPGVTAAPAIVAPGQSETELVLLADEQAPSWSGAIEVVTRATIDGAEAVVPARGATISLGASPERGWPQSRLSAQLVLGVTDRDAAPVQAFAGEGAPLEAPQGGAVAVPVRLVRRAGGEAKCLLRPQNVPPGVTLGEFEITPEQSAATPELKVAADAPVGDYMVWFQAEMAVKHAVQTTAHARAVAYRDRLQALLADPAREAERPALEQALAAAQARVDALAQESAPRDYTRYFSAASFRLRVLPAAAAPPP